MEKIIGLRCGHYGATSSTGTSGNGLVEKTINNDVFNYVMNRLKSIYGFTVYYKDGDLTQSLADYYNKYLPSNKYLLLPIHHDGNTDTSVNGSMVLCSVFASSNALTYAKYLLNEFCNTFGSKNRGILQRKNSDGKDYYFIIRKTLATVILGEALVLTNSSNANYIKNDYDLFVKKEGECYVKTACKWYGVTYIDPFTAVETVETQSQDITALQKEIIILKTEISNIKTILSTLQKQQGIDETLKTAISKLL